MMIVRMPLFYHREREKHCSASYDIIFPITQIFHYILIQRAIYWGIVFTLCHFRAYVKIYANIKYKQNELVKVFLKLTHTPSSNCQNISPEIMDDHVPPVLSSMLSRVLVMQYCLSNFIPNCWHSFSKFSFR